LSFYLDLFTNHTSPNTKGIKSHPNKSKNLENKIIAELNPIKLKIIIIAPKIKKININQKVCIAVNGLSLLVDLMILIDK